MVVVLHTTAFGRKWVCKAFYSWMYGFKGAALKMVSWAISVKALGCDDAAILLRMSFRAKVFLGKGRGRLFSLSFFFILILLNI
jgi:hypothetical protein